MKILSLKCPPCGALVEVPAALRRFDCPYCSCRLKVKKTEDRFVTETDGAGDDPTVQIGRTTALLIHNDLERLNREWEMEREILTSRTKDDEFRVPSTLRSIFWGLVVAGVGGGVAWWTYSQPLDRWVPIAGCAVALVGPLVAISGISRAMTYSSKKRAYERERRRLLGEIPGTR